MSKKKIFILISSIVFIILLIIFVCGSIYYTNTNNEKDALKFKEAYESLNNTIREADGETYNSVSIPENNPIKEINTKQALKLLKNGTGVIYIGANWCPSCRTILPTLFESASQNNIRTIYYLNFDYINSGFEVKDGTLIRNEEKMSENYQELISALDSVLKNETCKIKDDDGISYDTGEKAIYVPIVLTIKNGVITSYHSSGVSLEPNQTKYDPLTNKQEQELLDIYNTMFKTI